jgi:hypothetical protein
MKFKQHEREQSSTGEWGVEIIDGRNPNDATIIDIRQYMQRIPQEAEHTRDIASFEDRAWMDGEIRDRGENSILLPWTKLQGKFDIRDSELTVWAGESGAFKSSLLGMIAGFCCVDRRWMIASFEIPGMITARRMVRQLVGSERPTRDAHRAAFEWMGDSVRIFDFVGVFPYRKLDTLLPYAREVLGVDHFVVDSFTLLGCGSSNEKQIEAAQVITKAIRATGISVHLVAHFNKPPRGQRRNRGSKHDVRGAGEITDLADNVVLVEVPEPDPKDENPNPADLRIRIDKQRHAQNPKDPVFPFWRNDAGQFVTSGDRRVMMSPVDRFPR